MNRFIMNLIIIILMSLYSCSSKKNQNTTEYYKRDNLVYADAFIYESVIKIEQDSFVLAQYKEPFVAYVYRGIINRYDKNEKLIITDSKVISLNTGQLIDIGNQQGIIEFELTKSKIDEIQIRKYKNGELDLTFRYMPYRPIKKLNKLEKWFFNENSYSIEPFWPNKSKNESNPLKSVMLESEKQSRIEIGKLKSERQIKLENFVSQIAANCSIEVKDSLILSLTVKADGNIETYNIHKVGKYANTKVVCLDEFIEQTQLNFGKLKAIPSARTNSQKLTYTFSIE